METIRKTLILFYDLRQLKVTNENKYKQAIKEYTELYHKDINQLSLASTNEEEERLILERQKNYMKMVNNFYELVTYFYRWGWGDSFHFAQWQKNEPYELAIARHEYFLALKLNLHKGVKCIDLGCGVGGPAAAIARFSGAKVTGVNNSKLQIEQYIIKAKAEKLDNLMDIVQSDFHHTPFKNNTIDAAYAIEAECHSPDLTTFFKEVYRVLRPGGLVAGYDWCLTKKYDSKNKEHVDTKMDIEKGNSLPDIRTTEQVLQCLRDAGFEILENYDVADIIHSETHYPWYYNLTPSYTNSIVRFEFTSIGKLVAHFGIKMLQILQVAPVGTEIANDTLLLAADALVRGGRLEIFTPMYFYLAKKPEK